MRSLTKLKNCIIFVFVLVFILALCGCSNKTEKGIDKTLVREQLDSYIDTNTENGTIDSLTAFWYDNADIGKDLDIKGLDDTNGTIVLGTRSAKPFSYLMDNEWTGLTIEIIYNFCKEYGYGLDIKDFGDNNTIVLATSTGKCDIGGSNLSITEERAKRVDFSSVYYNNKIGIAIHKDNHDKYQTLEDFDGAVIGTVTGSAIPDLAPSLIPNFQHVEFNNLSDGCIALDQKKIEALSADEIVLHYAIKTFPNLELTCPLDDSDVFGFVYQKSDNAGGFLNSVAASFRRTFIDENRWQLILTGLINTLLITVISIIVGVALGFFVYLRCRNGGKVANTINRFCQWFVDGLPAVVFLMILYYLIFGNIRINNVVVSCIAFSLIFASASFTIIKTAVSGVDNSQYEVSYALGYSKKDTFYKMILPQAARLFWDPFKASVKAQIKATAIVGYIAAIDITKAGDMIRSSTFEAFFPLLVMAALYFVLGWLLSMLVDKIRLNVDPSPKKSERYLRGVRTDD